MSRGDDALVVVAAGPLSTIQDAGRWGHLRNGVPPAGAMDMIALAAANLLVGNAPGAAAVEFTLLKQMDRTVQDHVNWREDIEPLATGQRLQVLQEAICIDFETGGWRCDRMV